MLDQTLLYKCENNDAVSFLYGTVHVMDKDIQHMTNKVLPFLADVDCYAMEMDMTNGSLVNERLMKANLTANWSYRTQLRPRQYIKYRNIILKSFGVDIKFMDKLPPIYLVQILQGQSISNEGSGSVDDYLKNKALELDKEINYLETIDEQVNVYENLVLHSPHKKVLKDFVSNINASRRQVEQLLRLYKKMDINRLYQSSKKSLGKHKRVLLYQRNRLMADRFSYYSNHNSLFAAVGAAHLPGKYGMLKLLKDKGFKITGIRL